MSLEELFSKYALKSNFGKEFIPFAYDCRIYKIGGEIVLFEPVNKNQYRVHPVFEQQYKKGVEYENSSI